MLEQLEQLSTGLSQWLKWSFSTVSISDGVVIKVVKAIVVVVE